MRKKFEVDANIAKYKITVHEIEGTLNSNTIENLKGNYIQKIKNIFPQLDGLLRTIYPRKCTQHNCYLT